MGAGVFGRFHAQKYARLPGVALVAVADPDTAAVSRVAAELGTEAYGDHRHLFGRVDCVSIASPADTHAAIAEEFLRAGIDVYVEKPIATALAEADRLIASAAECGRVLQSGHQERFVFAASGLLARNERPLRIECHRAGPFSGRGTDVSVALDLMTHDLDLVHVLSPAPVVAVAAKVRDLAGSFSDEVSADLTLADGCEVSLFASRMADARRRFMRVTYADGAIEIDFIARTLANSTRSIVAPAFFGSRGEAPGIADDPLGFAIARFVEAVRGGPAPLVTPADARRALETALLILNAAGSPVTRAEALAA